MLVGLDATPLLAARTGVGRYVENLVGEFATSAPSDLKLVATAFTWRGLDGLSDNLPAGVGVRARRAPARALQALWARAEWPPIESIMGAADVFHATNFVLPPTRKARGVVTVHDLSFLRTPQTVSSSSARYRQLVPRSLARAAMVCTPSHAMAAEIESEYALIRDRIVVTPLGVDPAWTVTGAPSPEWLRDRGLPDRYLLFVGTLEPRKDLATLLRAYRLLVDDDPDAVPRLVLVGPQGWGPALDTAGVEPERIVMAGYLDEQHLRPVVAGAAALVMPSLYEGFGIPPLEALACGTPVVTSDLPVFAEVLGEHARRFPAQDAESLAAALRVTLSEGGPTPAEDRRRHASRWTWRACAEATMGAYRQALA